MVFVKLAVRLRGRGYDDALSMTPGQLVLHSKIVDEVDDADFTETALAMRFGHHGTEKLWKQHLKGK